MGRLIIKNFAAAAVAVAMLVGVSANGALTFTFDNGNPALSSLTPPFGTVSLTRVDDNNVTVTLTAFGLYSFGGQGTLGLNLNGGGTFSISGLSGTKVGGGSADPIGSQGYSLGGAANEDGWGVYNFTLDSFDGFTHSVTSLTFNLHTTSGAWTTESAILTPNSDHYLVAGHVMSRNSDGTDRGVTGYSTGTPVPEPSTMIAGALLLLPFAASTVRFMRKSRKA